MKHNQNDHTTVESGDIHKEMSSNYPSESDTNSLPDSSSNDKSNSSTNLDTNSGSDDQENISVHKKKFKRKKKNSK